MTSLDTALHDRNALVEELYHTRMRLLVLRDAYFNYPDARNALELAIDALQQVEA